MKPVRALPAAAALLLGAGCAQLQAGAGAVEVVELRALPVCNSASGEATISGFADAEALQRWQAARGIDLIGAAPLPPGPFAVIEHGARNTGGYALAVARYASVADGVLSLRASFISPPGGAPRSAQLTSPCTLVKLPPGNYRTLELVDGSGRRRALVAAATPPAPTP